MALAHQAMAYQVRSTNNDHVEWENRTKLYCPNGLRLHDALIVRTRCSPKIDSALTVLCKIPMLSWLGTPMIKASPQAVHSRGLEHNNWETHRYHHQWLSAVGNHCQPSSTIVHPCQPSRINHDWFTVCNDSFIVTIHQPMLIIKNDSMAQFVLPMNHGYPPWFGTKRQLPQVAKRERRNIQAEQEDSAPGSPATVGGSENGRLRVND